MKWFAYIICYLIYPFSFLVVRDKNRIAFGSFRGAFNDNSKYLFIYLAELHTHKKICWLSINRQTVKLVRSLGLPAEWVLSPKGAWLALRSKTWFVNSYTSDIMFCLSGGATVVNLWHGVGLKRCEFNINTGALAKRYVEKQFKEVFTHPESFRRPEYLISSSPFQSEMFAKAFRLPIERCLNIGYPRNTILKKSKEEILEFVKKYEPQSTLELIRSLNKYSKVYIYMPTWRDSQLDVFTEHFDLVQLEAIMAKQNALMLLKPHPNTKVSEIKESAHIQFIKGTVDVYGLLPFTDVLITDYSSILYDYLLIPNKNVVLYLYDMEEYVKDRDFYYPFEENVCGKKVNTWEELVTVISDTNATLDQQERDRIVRKFWGQTMEENQDVCANLLKELQLSIYQAKP